LLPISSSDTLGQASSAEDKNADGESHNGSETPSTVRLSFTVEFSRAQMGYLQLTLFRPLTRVFCLTLRLL